MDTSPEYILQCEKAEEIQKNWQPSEWDYVYGERDGEKQILVLSGYCTDGGFYGAELEGAELEEEDRGVREIVGVLNPIWLLRQDQLQEMVINRVFGGAEALIRWAFSWHETLWNIHPYESMEQFWLMFVMKDNGKVWNGEDWVKDNKK